MTQVQQNTLIHNIAGELAGLYVNYLAKQAMGQGLSHDYFKKNWHSEYKSRVKLMEADPTLIDKLNGFNDFYKADVYQNSEIRRTFYYEQFK